VQVPNSFIEALDGAYKSKSKLDKLFVEQKPFIMRMVKHALRYNPWQLISDENDLYQEACIWLLHFMWEWDEEKGKTLSEYVTYNIGIRLKNQVDKEMAGKRSSKAPPLSIVNSDIQENEFCDNTIRETFLESNTTDAETLLSISQVYNKVNNELPFLAGELLECLLLENGNVVRAGRMLREQGRIRGVTKSEDTFRQWLKRKYFPMLRSVLKEAHIISSEDRL
jgi:hypothetical protein